MGRPLRTDIQGGWHHVMNRGVDRQRIFLDDRDRVEFERLLTDASARHGLELHAVCLMGNHYHLVVHCPSGGLSAAMHHLGARYARHVNDRHRRDGPLCRSRFHSVPIGDDAQLLQTVRYVHRNPLDLGPGTRLDTYRWSSHRAYLGRRRRPPYLTTEAVLELFDHDVDRYDRFVTDDDRGPSSGTATTVEDPVDTVRRAVRSLPQRHLIGGRDADRALELLLLADDHGLRGHDLAARLGYTTPSAARTALARARRLVGADPEFAALVETARRLHADSSDAGALRLVPGTRRSA